MRPLVRNLVLHCVAVLPLAAVLGPTLQAQEDGPPKVLVIDREFLKPGKAGAQHNRTESAIVKAFTDANVAYPYFALDSLSGPSRSLFMFGYDSFADWQKQTTAIPGNPALAAKLDQANQADSDLLSVYESAAAVLRPDLSLNKGKIEGTRYFEITLFIVKPGHGHDFEELAKMYVETWRKIDTETHWDTFEVMYGNPSPSIAGGDIFLVVNTMKSLADTDKSIANSDKFAGAAGDENMKKVRELSAASIASVNTNLFVINPRMSNPPPEWVKREPAFWKGQ
jgi:hypothetical protein